MQIDETGTAYVAESADDFTGWTILAIEDWKPGVVRVEMYRKINEAQAEFMGCFSKVEYAVGLHVDNSVSFHGN